MNTEVPRLKKTSQIHEDFSHYRRSFFPVRIRNFSFANQTEGNKNLEGNSKSPSTSLKDKIIEKTFTKTDKDKNQIGPTKPSTDNSKVRVSMGDNTLEGKIVIKLTNNELIYYIDEGIDKIWEGSPKSDKIINQSLIKKEETKASNNWEHL